MALDEKLVLLMVRELRMQEATLIRYKKYYDGNHDILLSYRMNQSMSNMKLVFNFPKKFTKNMTGYLLGKALNYSSKSGNDALVHLIDKHTSTWEKAHNQQLSILSEQFGYAYEIVYSTLAPMEFKASAVSPINMYCLDDGTSERNITLAVHMFDKQFDKTKYLDVYDADYIYHYTINGNKLTLLDQQQHIFGRVPVNVCYANPEGECGYKDIMNLLDAYENIHSDLTNEISDHRNAMLTFEGGTVKEDDLPKMKTDGIIQTPTGVKASWLIKDMNDTFVQNQLKNIRDEIFILSDQVDFNANWASNTSGMALRNKLLDLSHRCSIKGSLMEYTIYQRLRHLFRFLQVKEGATYDYTDVRIKFTLDLPFDITSTADALSKMDFLSQETKLSYLDTVDNPLVELEKLRKEQQYQNEQDMKNRIPLDYMGNGGANG